MNKLKTLIFTVKAFFYKINIFRYIKNYLFCLRYPFWKLTDNWYCYNTSTKDKRIGVKNFFIVYNRTWYDDIPTGWQKAFGKQMSKEIKLIGKSYLTTHKDKTWKDILVWEQIKEKYGTLRLYSSCIDEINKLTTKYEQMSCGYCIVCGKPAKYCTKGWVEYYCEKCYLKHLKWNNKFRDEPYTEEQINRFKQDERLTEKDIPILTTYEYKTIVIERFKTKEECFAKKQKLIESQNGSKEYWYYPQEKKDGTWELRTEQHIAHEIDNKKEFGIDFYELWGLN